MTSPPDAPGLVVPAYVHPRVDPGLWARLVEAAPVLRLVVVNPHDGPGREVDPAYPPVVAALRAAGVRMAGYVDTAYGQRSPAEVAADVALHGERYGLAGVFLDQVSTGLDQLEHYGQVVRLSRAAGARFVALNHGAVPHPGYLDLANLTVTFEGPWQAWLTLAEPAWLRRQPVRRLCHLVHAVPPVELGRGLTVAGDRHAGALMLTDGTGANPWDRLPEAVLAPLLAARVPAPDAEPEQPVPGRAVRRRGALGGLLALGGVSRAGDASSRRRASAAP